MIPSAVLKLEIHDARGNGGSGALTEAVSQYTYSIQLLAKGAPHAPSPKAKSASSAWAKSIISFYF